MAITLASLKKGREIKPPLIVRYGVHGIGKTSWAAEAIDPVICQTEEGANAFDVVKFPLSRSIHDVFGAISALMNEEHSFKTFVLDTIDWYERLVHNEVRQKHGESIFADLS